jgi:menaquinone C8-methyltransferase
MMVEYILTKIGRSRTSKYLNFDTGRPVALPPAEPGKKYMLYLHIPFCEVLCPYCSFNRIPFESKLAGEYFEALLAEMKMYKNAGYSFESLYIGGGTPTVIPRDLARVISRAKEYWQVKNVSVETNPDHLEDPIIKLLKTAGVSRLSVGVQTFQDDLLRKLQRYDKYGSGESMKSRLMDLRGTFETLNIDMIFNFPSQTQGMVAEDLKTVLEIGADQVTFYPLMASRLKKQELTSALGNVDYRKEKKLFSIISKTLQKEYTPASAWCFSRKVGLIDEYIIDYNEYAGLGSGAFGYVGGSLYSNTFSVSAYIEKIRSGDLPLAEVRGFSLREQLQYELLTSLFSGKANLEIFNTHLGLQAARHLWPEVTALRLSGAVKKAGSELTLTKRGTYYMVILMREFFNGVNYLREQRLLADSL